MMIDMDIPEDIGPIPDMAPPPDQYVDIWDALTYDIDGGQDAFSTSDDQWFAPDITVEAGQEAGQEVLPDPEEKSIWVEPFAPFFTQPLQVHVF